MKRTILACPLPRNEVQRQKYIRQWRISKRWRKFAFTMMIVLVVVQIAGWILNVEPTPLGFINLILGIVAFYLTNQWCQRVNGKPAFKQQLAQERGISHD